MTHRTPDDLLVLHAVRVLGFADERRVAGRAGLPADDVVEHLEDARARGWVSVSSWLDVRGWAMTEAGKAEGERRLAEELDATGSRSEVEDVHRAFLPLNDDVARACTSWQLGGTADPTVTVAALERPAAELRVLEQRLVAHLARFAGYHERFAAALARAGADPAWITATDRESCHHVWFELHEDLIATLGLSR